MRDDLVKDPFEEYIKQGEPDKASKGYYWSAAVGLQAVDGLKPSKYLIEIATKNIEGDISLEEVKDLLRSYYNEKSYHSSLREEEADIVSSHIVEVLCEKAFSLTPNEYMSIHRKLFNGVFDHAGKIRDYNITKKEWVLDGETVIYGSASELWNTLEYDFSLERKFNYKGLTIDEIIEHLAHFVAGIWQIHVFGEGNTRTTAVFLIKYLRYLGFSATNDIFAKNAWYFRNALVRANYRNLKLGIHETTKYLELFLKNLLLNEKNELRNRDMYIGAILTEKPDIGFEKTGHSNEKPDIGDKETGHSTDYPLIERDVELSSTSRFYIKKLFDKFGWGGFFGRTEVMKTLNLKESRSSEFLSLLLRRKLIEPVSGHGKGKYKFKKTSND